MLRLSFSNRRNIFAMEINATWASPIDLVQSDSAYDLDLARIEDHPAVYVIGRRFGDSCVPLYIGRTAKLRRRMKQHFDSRRFMSALREFPNGTRFLAWSTFQLKQGQRLQRVMGIVERGLIAHALSENHQLINIQGTKTPVDTVNFTGNLSVRNIFGMSVLVQK
jgi:predicted GIY-YIG superfamily endonuclease